MGRLRSTVLCGLLALLLAATETHAANTIPLTQRAADASSALLCTTVGRVWDPFALCPGTALPPAASPTATATTSPLLAQANAADPGFFCAALGFALRPFGWCAAPTSAVPEPTDMPPALPESVPVARAAPTLSPPDPRPDPATSTSSARETEAAPIRIVSSGITPEELETRLALLRRSLAERPIATHHFSVAEITTLLTDFGEIIRSLEVLTQGTMSKEEVLTLVRKQADRTADTSSDSRSRLQEDLTTEGSFIRPELAEGTLTDSTLRGTTTLSGLTAERLLQTSAAGTLAATPFMVRNDSLLIGTTTPQEALTLDGALYLADHTPSVGSNRLYNVGGSLYWNGSIVTSSSTANWSGSGGDVYRLTGNVGVGLSSPSVRLHTDGGDVRFNDSSDNPGFYFDESTGRVGVGTTSPDYMLDVFGISDERKLARWTSDDGDVVVINQNGLLGIGTTTPQAGLHLIGSDGGSVTGLLVDADGEAGDTAFKVRTGSDPSILTDADTKFVINNQGYVGIGTTGPNAKLTLGNNVGDGFDEWSDYQLLLYTGGSPASSYGMGIKSNTLAFNTNQDFDFDQDGSTVMTIDDGNVGIGTTSPDSI